MSRREKRDDLFYKKLLDDLLEEIGLETADGKVVDSFIELNRHGKFIRDMASSGVCRIVVKQGPAKYLVCQSYKKLAECFKNVRAFKFLAVGSSIVNMSINSKDNPWLGYTIDELLVYRDLLVGKSKAEDEDGKEQ